MSLEVLGLGMQTYDRVSAKIPPFSLWEGKPRVTTGSMSIQFFQNIEGGTEGSLRQESGQSSHQEEGKKEQPGQWQVPKLGRGQVLVQARGRQC